MLRHIRLIYSVTGPYWIIHISLQSTMHLWFHCNVLTYPKNHPNEIIPKPVHCFTPVWMNHQHDDEYHRHLMKKSSRRDLTVSGLSEGPQLNVSRIISTCLLCLLVTMHLLITDIEDTFENAQWGKSHKQMQREKPQIRYALKLPKYFHPFTHWAEYQFRWTRSCKNCITIDLISRCGLCVDFLWSSQMQKGDSGSNGCHDL